MTNLLPPYLKKDLRFARYNVELTHYLAIIVIVFIVLIFTALIRTELASDDIEELRTQVNEKQTELVTVKAAEQRVEDLSKIIGPMKEGLTVSSVFSEARSALPADVAVLRVSVETPNSAQLVLNTSSQDQVAEVVQTLSTAYVFVQVEVVSIERVGDRFNLLVEMSVNEAEPLLEKELEL